VQQEQQQQSASVEGSSSSYGGCLGRMRGFASLLPPEWEASQQKQKQNNNDDDFKGSSRGGGEQEGSSSGGEFSSFNQGRWAADVLVHPSGKWLFVTNRLHDSIVTFAINPTTRETAKEGRVGSSSSGIGHGISGREPAVDPTATSKAEEKAEGGSGGGGGGGLRKGFLGMFGGGGGASPAPSLTHPPAVAASAEKEQEGGQESYWKSARGGGGGEGEQEPAAVLEFVSHTPCGGKTPRNFCLSPDGRHLVVGKTTILLLLLLLPFVSHQFFLFSSHFFEFLLLWHVYLIYPCCCFVLRLPWLRCLQLLPRITCFDFCPHINISSPFPRSTITIIAAAVIVSLSLRSHTSTRTQCRALRWIQRQEALR
jgi:hypothetical protein